MSTIAQAFGFDTPPKYEVTDKIRFHTIGVGIEIEAEGFDELCIEDFNETESSRWWHTKPDGSLRNEGVEFCSVVMFGKTVVDALEAVRPSLSRCDINWRAGIHVHVDVRELSVNELGRVCSLYGMLERLIFAWEGNNRQDSNFCVPWYICNDAAAALGEIINASGKAQGAVNSYQFRALNRLGKYSALNVVPVTTQGSIEFRMMQTTDDLDKILDFVNICTTIVGVCKQVEDSPLNLLSTMGPESFLRDFLQLPDFIEIPGYESMLWQGVDVGNIIPIQARDVPINAQPTACDTFPIIDPAE